MNTYSDIIIEGEFNTFVRRNFADGSVNIFLIEQRNGVQYASDAWSVTSFEEMPHGSCDITFHGKSVREGREQRITIRNVLMEISC